MGILKAPAKMSSPIERHRNAKHCDFHQDHGHDIKQYIELMKEIENAICQGLLKDFISQRADYGQENRKNVSKNTVTKSLANN